MKNRILLMLLVCVPSHAAWSAPKSNNAAPLGLYGNVRMSAQTGDLGGQEIRIFKDSKTSVSMVEFVDCEGWCNITYSVPLNRDDGGYWFEYTEKFYDEVGNVSDEGRRRYHFTMRGKAMVLSGTFPDCSDCSALGPYKLKRLNTSFGLDVANNKP